MAASSPRKIRWWQRLFDPEVRTAVRRMKELQSGDMKMATVDYTDGGIAITIPESIRHEWDSMPYDAQQDFLRMIDQQVSESAKGKAPQLNETYLDGGSHG